MDAADRGHRRGNFPNYYAFHPPANRLEVLERTGLLAHLRRGLRPSDEEFAKRRLVGVKANGAAGASADAGHDESLAAAGDLEEDVANSDGSARKKPRLDNGAHPSSSKHIIRYCDLGCNEGDLMMAVATALASASSSGEEAQVATKCLGLDLDPMLIARAKSKFSPGNEPSSEGRSNSNGGDGDVDAAFQVCNLCSKSEHNNACSSFMRDIAKKNCGAAAASNDAADPGEVPSKTEQSFHLTTIFSTTMWIHVHAGDDGLRAFLERASQWTKRYLLIEPQPSGCPAVLFLQSYRKANVRLRKMGRPELDDVSSSRLKMRPDIEKEIENIVLGCGFRRVALDELEGERNESVEGETQRDVTKWNRTVHLYERISERTVAG
ncbi:hypothetical protein ACHAXT_005176 [Thalassiosira profunda]